MSLDNLREDIDRIDRDVVKLLDERARIARRIAEEKTRLGLPLRNREREAAVLRGIVAVSDGSMPAAGLESIYRGIMAETLALEERPAGDSRPAPSICAPSRKLDVAAEVAENREIAPGFYRMRLVVPELAGAFAPGQFFQIRLYGGRTEPFLRRPFAPSELIRDGFAFVYAVVGGGTRLMTGLTVGSRVGILGPLGKGYTLAPKGSEAALIGGGCGGPSLGPLVEKLAADGVRTTVVIGARTACSLLGREYMAKYAHRLVAATDDGSEGVAGNAVAALEKRLGDAVAGLARVYACGPLPMLKAAAGLAAKRGVPCEVSLEERMACGFGACVGCVVEAAGKEGTTVFRRVCHDGPVFDARELAWDRIATS